MKKMDLGQCDYQISALARLFSALERTVRVQRVDRRVI